MRIFVGAISLAVAMNAATSAAACPIDLAPCEEVRPLGESIDARIDWLISSLSGAPAVQFDESFLLSLSAGTRPSGLVHTFEGDALAADDQIRTATLSEHDGPHWDMLDAMPGPGAGFATVPTRRFLLDDEDLIEADYTGSVSAPSKVSDTAPVELALDGYEDR
jgi:hypothetical protein